LACARRREAPQESAGGEVAVLFSLRFAVRPALVDSDALSLLPAERWHNGSSIPARKDRPAKGGERVKHILTAWEKFREMTIPKDAPETQIVEMRNAFIAGAAQLFFLITTRLEPGLEATENDLGFMDAIATEIDEWAAAKLAEIKGGH
jgi:hypothetical protein